MKSWVRHWNHSASTSKAVCFNLLLTTPIAANPAPLNHLHLNACLVTYFGRFATPRTSQNAARGAGERQAGFSYGRGGRMTAMMMIRRYRGAVSHRCRRPFQCPPARSLSLSLSLSVSMRLFQLDGQNGRKKRTAESRRPMARDES